MGEGKVLGLEGGMLRMGIMHSGRGGGEVRVGEWGTIDGKG